MRLSAQSRKTTYLFVIWTATVAVICLQFLGITTREPGPKSFLLMTAWVPYLCVCLFAIRRLVSRKPNDELVYARFLLVGFLVFLVFGVLWQTNFFSGHVTTTDGWNRFLGINMFVILIITAAVEAEVVVRYGDY